MANVLDSDIAVIKFELQLRYFVLLLTIALWIYSAKNLFVSLDLVKEKNATEISNSLSYLPTPALGQDMTQGQFFSGV